MRFIIIISIAGAVIAGCTFDKGDIPVPTVPCDTTLTYSANIQALVSIHCTNPGCHQPASVEGDLTNYNGLKIKVDNGKLKQKVLVEGSMPPTTPLNAEDKRKIECWLVIGAPEN
jgi:hypothetical protein